jgi:hypothetical protein
VDRLIDSGRRIGITRRNFVRSSGLTGHYYCEFQFKRCLKVERQSFVQVVLLSDINLSTKIVGTVARRYRDEDILKNCDGGITRSSSVFCLSKTDEAERKPLLRHNLQAQKIYL